MLDVEVDLREALHVRGQLVQREALREFRGRFVPWLTCARPFQHQGPQERRELPVQLTRIFAGIDGGLHHNTNTSFYTLPEGPGNEAYNGFPLYKRPSVLGP